MGLASFSKIRKIIRNCWTLPFPAALLVVAGLTGCNTCFTFTSPNGMLGIVSSDPRPPCMLPKVNAAVRPQLAAEPVCNSCIGSGQVQHIFLSIRGLELNSTATARDDAMDWLELLPSELEQNPVQIDLMDSNADKAVQASFGKTAVVPGGIYRQLRLRLVSNQPAATDRLPETNACGGETFNCIVMANGAIHPLQLDAASPELRITSAGMEGASLLFPPDTRTDLIIEWKLDWELSSSSETGAHLLPMLAGSAKISRINLDELGAPENELVNDFRSTRVRD
jgi:hypothetical protein